MKDYKLIPFDHDLAVAGAELIYEGENVQEFVYLQKAKICNYIVVVKGLPYRVSRKSAEIHIKIKQKLHTIPFDPEKLAEGWEVKTREGKEVDQLVIFKAKKAYYPVHGVVEECITNWTVEGVFHINGPESELDLFMYQPDRED